MPRELLAATRTGGGPPVVLVHGFTQTARCWGDLPARLASRAEVLAVDAPGHGASSGVEAGLWATADLLAAVTGDRPATIVGYSMGARMALHAAIAHPDTVERLVLVSGTAGIDDPRERADRRRSDDALASRIEAIGVPAFLDQWLALPLFASLPDDARDRAERETNTAAGLAASLRTAGTGTQESLWGRLAGLSMPTLVVAGAADPKFTALARRLVDGIAGPTTLAVVEGAGHTVHREQPDRFATLLASWLG
jgi:2-succinyl-6-hydroxy-2,4-cyclohexadiene-1-carboxylate synthase